MSWVPSRLNRWCWTASRRRVLIIGLCALSAWLAVRLYFDRKFVPDPLPAVGSRAGELHWKIDLNSADFTTLSAIPRLGESRAKAIIDYRTQFEAAHSGRRAFEQLEDLFHVKGIGAGTVANIKPFVTINPATKPSQR